jgi:hypothetical protein
MAVIIELSVGGDEFALGRILSVAEGSRVRLETLVPLGEPVVPLVWVRDGPLSFRERVSEHRLVSAVEEIERRDGDRLYAIDWTGAEDALLSVIRESNAYLLTAEGEDGNWQFELRFGSHDGLDIFRNRCSDDGICIDVACVYNPTKPGAGPYYGLTPAQREAIMLAIQSGYYNLPRDVTTKDLGAELGISDQAVTERLRRGITNLVEHTLLVDSRE